MITHLTVNDWTDVLDEDAIPIRERLAIAFQFLDDKALPSFLRSVVDQSIQRGDLTGLIVTGFTAQGMEILQKYVDVTGDVQTAAIISSLRVPSLITHNGKTLTKSVVDRWVEAYQDLLDGWKLFHHRCQFDIERGKIIQEALGGGDGQRKEWQPRQIMIRCNLCNKTVDVASTKGKGVSERLVGVFFLVNLNPFAEQRVSELWESTPEMFNMLDDSQHHFGPREGRVSSSYRSQRYPRLTSRVVHD